jgi:pimeloyl-ACP methyl ester carboxylesterase
MKYPLTRFCAALRHSLVAITSIRAHAKAPLLWLAVLTVAASNSCAEEFDFDSAGVKIHYLVEGTGEPVILIHGLLASAKLNWQWPGIVTDLAKNHRVIAMDCRGHGLSDQPTGEDQYGVKMVDDVVRLMDHLSITNADIVGYSMGGMITMKLMVLHPERVRSAVVGGMGWMENGDLFPGAKEAKLQSAIVSCMIGFRNLAVSAKDVRSIKTPFIVVVGDGDPLRKQFVEPLHQLRPDVPVKIVEGANHLTCVTKPAFKEEIKVFLENQPAKKTPN